MEPCWKQVTALFGGTFDPPHFGHVQALQGLLERPGVRNIFVLPSGSPPLKMGFSPSQDRFKMAQLAFDSLDSRITVHDFEIHHRPQPSYTWHTLKHFSREIPHLAFVIGTDQLAQLPRWHRIEETLALAHWIVLRRPGASAPPLAFSGELLQERSSEEWLIRKTGKIMKIFPTNAPELSSTLVRETYQKTGHPPPRSIPEAVERYLNEHPIYGT